MCGTPLTPFCYFLLSSTPTIDTEPKKLVVYFSASGVTKNAAEKLAKAAGADIFELRPTVPYTRADLNWMDKNSRSSKEMNDAASRPEIAALPQDMSGYDTVFIGFPIWWYTAPRIIETFLDSCDLSGKTAVCFATSGGSTVAKAEKELKAKYPAVIWKSGRMLNSASDSAIAALLGQL